MKIFLLIILFLISLSIYSLDIGTGVLGACTQADFTATDSGPYNCASLTVGGDFNFIGDTGVTDPVIIKVTGDVIINNILSVNGADGTDGVAMPGALPTGGEPGRGGFAGGDGTGTNVTGESGVGVGAGHGGTAGTGNSASGGGGGGASYGSVGTNGDNGVAGGGTAGSGGSAGSIYGAQANFKYSFTGGSGGGAGGPGENNIGVIYSGASGAGSGGAIRIMAGGNITIVGGGSIQANGGNGGAGPNFSGAGGGASGGAIFLESLGNVIVDGTITAEYGDCGIAVNNGDGGDGGNGRIRIDDADGGWTGGGTVDPVAYQIVVDSDISTATRIDSGISCGSISLVGDSSDYIFSIFLGIISLLGAMRLLGFGESNLKCTVYWKKHLVSKRIN